ncbi:MAG: alpha/beta fold hydrolase [Planctomycetes bacterium]|nr:alpha/beta fold hydrolase [Planctomycetota bacterium]MBL7143710.1 alpha/beta fold hydrolase [Phycisphaerae bacterium]
MNRLKNITIIFLLAVLISSDLAFSVQPNTSIVGSWMSKPGQFNIVFRVSKNEDGSFDAYTDFPGEEAWDIPVDLILPGSMDVRFDIYNIRCAYEGKISLNGRSIDGKFKGPDGGGMPLVLEKVDNPPVRTSKRPQEPKKPYPYKEELVSFENRLDKVTLAGTLTLPESPGPYPAVLLLSGSGGSDRDQLIWGHRSFLVLADYLTRQGIAVLRYDDRGVGRSTGNYDASTFEDFKRDALAGVEYLKTLPQINTEKIGLAGHSEGAAIAPLVAAESTDVAFMVLMAAPGLSDDFEGLLKQFTDGYRSKGASRKAITFKASVLRNIFYTIRQEDDLEVARSKIKNLLQKAKPELAKFSANERQKIELESMDTYKFDWMLSPGFSSILRYNPEKTLMKVKCPVLALHGDRDMQIPKENLKGIEATLKTGGNHQYLVKEFSGLNHLFQTAKTGSPSEYAKIEETISPIVLNMMSDWILKQASN